MITKELINHMIPPLKPNDTAEKAISWMEELRYDQLPVVEEARFRGLLSEDIILEENNLNKLVGDFDLIAPSSVVSHGQHFYDVVKVASEYGVNIVAVLDDEDFYLGAITVQDTIASFAQTATVKAPGAILVLSLPAVDYSLSEISRLIEAENSKILGSSIREDPLDPNKIKLTLKINKTDLAVIVATLERFNYKIIARFQEPEQLNQDRDRVNTLLRYLEI